MTPPPGWAPDAAQVEAVDRGPVIAPAEPPAQVEHLVEGHRAVEDVAAGEAVIALEVERRDRVAYR